jgi:phosphoglycerol transferase MdoB-like AlkP superfamily enzyme
MIKKLWKKLEPFGPYAPLIAMYIISLPILSLSRIGLMIWQSERVAATGAWPEMLLQGIRIDLIQLGLLAIIPLLILPLFAHKKAWRWWKKLTYLWVATSIILLLFLEAASPGFITEYNTRPDRLFIEYLKYPKEVIPMLWNGFRVSVFAAVGLIIAAVWLLRKWLKPWLSYQHPSKNIRYWIALPFVILLVAFSVRSTTDHRPANPAMFAITSDTMVNSLILNSTWSVFHAIYNLKHESKSSEIYGDMDLPDIMKQVQLTRDLLQDKRPLLGNPDIPTLTEQTASVQREKPLNLVIVLQESLGATFVESLGGLPVTPELEKLKSQGWWFENLYATGTRSVRGIEAVTSGFLPTPAQSTVKLSLSQNNFFTLASLLGKQGYASEFIYGGEGHFDNMRNFFLGNGFDAVVDKENYVNPIFTGSWGVSDEDLFNKTHEQLMKHHADGRPFFTLVFSSSNHTPFEFPDGRIDLYEQPKASENNAVKYADYAYGEFFKKAKVSPYWKDTLFLIVADHDIRVRGDDLVPVKNFHIPGLILGADLEPRVIKSVASQIDLPTTLLSLMGINAQHPMIGRDISAEPEDLAGRAMMQYQQNYAWMEGSQAVVLRADKAPTYATYDKANKKLIPSDKPSDAAEMYQRALSHVLLPSLLYREQQYHLPKP